MVLLLEVGAAPAMGSEELLSIKVAFSVGKTWMVSALGCG